MVRNYPTSYQTGSLIPAWEPETRKWPSASTILARSSQKEAKINTQLPPLCRTPWWQRPHSKTDSLVQPSPDNTTQALIQSQGIATSRFEWDLAHLVKPKSPPDRDWTMQIPYVEMGIQRGWTDNVRMWGWTHAGLPHPVTTVYPWRHGRVQPPS